MKKMKRSVTLMLASLMTVGAMAIAPACSCKGDSDYDDSNFLTREEAIEEFDNEYRIVRKEITLNLFVPRGSMNPKYNTMKVFKTLSKLTGINFEFTEADTGNYTQTRTLAWNSDEWPDLFLFSNTMAEQVEYAELDALVPFNDPNLEVAGVEVGSLIDNYMPTYKNLLETNFGIEDAGISAKDVATLGNGMMYSTVSANDVPRDLSYKMWINQKWIDNINTNTPSTLLEAKYGVSEIPSADDIHTIDDLLIVLRAFRDLDPDGDGKTSTNPKAMDEIPVSSLSMEYVRNFLMAAYGIVSNGVEISNDGTSFSYSPASDAYREYLKTARMMWEEGLMDQNTFQNSAITDKGYAGRLGMFCSAAAYLTVGEEKDSDYEVFGPLTSDYYGTKEGENPLQLGFSYFKADVAVIPNETPYVREIARLLDILYSDLGVQLMSYGEEGVDWEWKDDNTAWTFNVPSSWDGTQEEYRATITPNVGTGACVFWSYDFVGKMDDPIIKRLNSESERYIPYLKVPQPEDIILTVEDYNEISLANADLNPLVKSMEYYFITYYEKKHDINSDSDWNAYIKDLKDNGYEGIVSRYNRALANKK